MTGERDIGSQARIAPGDRTPVHTHRWPAVLYVLSWSDFVRYDDKGEVLLDSRLTEAQKNERLVDLRDRYARLAKALQN